MSEIKVNKISPRTACGTTTLGDSGDTFTIPSGVSITNQGTASGFGSTGEVSWVTTKKTSTFTVTSGEGYFCDTSSAGFTVNLPAGTAGNSFAVADYTNTFQTNALTISPNGSQKIGGVAQDAILSTEGQSAYFVYVDDTEGWKNVIDSTSNVVGLPPFVAATGGTITTTGDFKIHKFTGPGTFTVTNAGGPSGSNTVDYLVVGGGASGGVGNTAGGAGGGAGGVRVSPGSASGCWTASPLGASPAVALPVSIQGYPITVGAGGAARTSPANGQAGDDGSVSTFSTITSAGGGKGAGHDAAGGSGGSGGGGAGAGPNMPGPGYSGNTPSVNPPQGQDGGNGGNGAPNYPSGGGGGAGGAAPDITNTTSPGGAGGAGIQINICGSNYYWAGGGGGEGYGLPGGAGGIGGGGGGSASGGENGPVKCGGAAGGSAINTAGASSPVNGGNGAANSGGGGGGAVGGAPGGPGSSGGGGSGIVIIRYKFQ